MKRPFAVIGFSMLITFLVITNITHKMTIALLSGAVVIFCCFLIVKDLRKYLSVIFALFGVIVFTTSFVVAEKYYFDEMKSFEKEQTLTGVVCQMPTDSDYAFTYIIKPDGKNYKIRFVTESNAFIREGDYVKMHITHYENYEETDMLENSLSSKVYFTFFANDECYVEKTGKTNLYYKTVGSIKREFAEIVMKYLPGRNGVIALAMTIGEKAELDEKTIDLFNYSGTSHLLVISGLHLTMWSFGIMKILNKFSKTRKYSSVIGLLCLVAYSSITGFSVSVIRAGFMVGAVLISRMFSRDADSINSIGMAVSFILLENPFAPKSVALWLTALSTIGILAYSGMVSRWLEEKFKGKLIAKTSFYNALVTSIAISFSTSVFTMPVFLYKLKMIPIVSLFANLIMVDVAMALMVVTVIGVICHIVFLYPFSRICFFIVGVLGELLHFTAEKCGMSEWTTLSLNHKYYKYFFIILLITIIIIVALKKYKSDIMKRVSIVFTLLFCVVAVFCTIYEKNTSSVEIVFTSDKPVITVCSEGKSVLVGVQDKKQTRTIKELLNKHNEKQLDGIVVIEEETSTISELIYLYENFGHADIYFTNEAPALFKKKSKGFVTDLSLSKKTNINMIDDGLTVIELDGKSIITVDCKKVENIFEKIKEYDIIILYGRNSDKVEALLKERLDSVQIIVSEEGKKGFCIVKKEVAYGINL